MATIPELLDGHITLEVECVDRLYLNGYIGKLATGPGLSMFMRFQLEKPVPSPVVLGQVSEKFRAAVKTQAEREDISIYQFDHKERKDDIANNFRRQRQVRDGVIFIGVAQEKAQAFNGKKVNGQFEFHRDKAVDVNHYYFYIDDEDFGPLFIKVCRYAPVEHEVVPQRARMGQTTTGEKEDRLSGPGQRVSVLRPAGQTTTDLRLFGAGGNRPGIPQVVEADSAEPQDREEISAVSNHFRLPAMAFKITSCTFIIRSVPQRTLADWLLVHLQRGPRSHKRTDHLLIGLDNSHAKNIAFSFAVLLLDIPNIR
jgi:hypothetical protein